MERTQYQAGKTRQRHITVKFKSIRAKDRLTKAPDRLTDLPQKEVSEPGGGPGCASDRTDGGEETFEPRSLCLPRVVIQVRKHG